MDRRKFSLSLLGGAVAGLTGCGGNGGSNPVAAAPAAAPAADPVVPPNVLPVVAGPELATATSLPAATVFLQTIAATDGDGSAAPGQANYWDLDTDFSIGDGGNDQFDGALALSIDVGGTGTVSFPNDQQYTELTAFGPELSTSEGVKSVSFTTDPAFVNTGTTSAVLHPVPNARLQQTLQLTSAVGAVALTWSGTDNANTNSFSDEPYYFRVVLRDGAGGLVATLFSRDTSGSAGTWGSANLTAYAGQTVVLSFEQSSSEYPSIIDGVSVLDGNGVQFVTNGDFEAGGAGWTVPAVRVSQNVSTGVRTLNGLDVQRFFFTQPDALWGRMTDVFYNPTASAIQAVVSYDTNLGSDGYGIIYPTPGATQKALTTWDGMRSDRDIGMIFGTADSVAYTSATAIMAGDGSDQVRVQFNISVPAGGRVSLVNFVVFTGTDTGLTAADTSARATQVDTQAADIANNFRTNFAYQRGMTQVQLDTLKNL